MSRQNISLGRILGIRIGLDYSWFLIFALFTWLLAQSYYPVEFKNWRPRVSGHRLGSHQKHAALYANRGDCGRFFGFSFIFLGVLKMFAGDIGDGVWIALIGWFLDNAASGQVRQVTFQGLLEGHKVSQAMSSHCPSVPGDLTLQQLVDEHVLVGNQRCFLITRGQDTVGLMTLHRIKEVPRREWATTSAAEVMLPLEQSKRTNPDTELWTALQQMDRDGVKQLPVTQDNQVIGMLSREELCRVGIACLQLLQVRRGYYTS